MKREGMREYMIEDRADLEFAETINRILRRKRVNVAPTINSPKPFTWSYSKLKNYESCPRRYYEVDVTKAWAQDDSEELRRGNALHLAMKNRVKKGTELPVEFAYMEPWAVKLAIGDNVYCEMKLALTRDMKMTGWSARDVYYRGIIDYLHVGSINDLIIGSLVDYKTGKPKEDDTQLGLSAALVFAHNPKIVGISATFLWTEYDDTSHASFKRSHIKETWDAVKPRVAKLEQATKDGEFPAIKNFLCREWCPVLSCEHNGKR
jgi:hypothetical protein